MNDWGEGYLTDINYTHGYYRELSPGLMRFALVSAGFSPPEPHGAYLELGCGQGLSACIHAAATPYEIWASDFNPSHALNASRLLHASGVEAHILDHSFSDLAHRGDLPQFNHIVAHGVWTWVSDANRENIVDVLHRNLALGGAAYLSHNTLPGWGAAQSLRRLMRLHAEMSGAKGQGVARQVDAAIAFAQEIVQSNSLFFNTHPDVTERLNRIAKEDPRYIAHEYFNRDWRPMLFSELADRLSRAKLGYSASANLLDHVSELNLSAKAQAMLNAMENAPFRETVRDFFVNQLFRRDIFQRGHCRLSPAEQARLLNAAKVALQTPPEDIVLKLIGPVGEVSLQKEIYLPIVEAMASNAYIPKSIFELKNIIQKVSFPQLLQALKVLIGIGHAFPAQEDDVIEKIRLKTTRLNTEIFQRAEHGGDISYLASPVLGAGVLVPRVEQLFLLGRATDGGGPGDWAHFAWEILARQGTRIAVEGKSLETPEECAAELRAQATLFATKRLPILQALGVA